MTIDDSDRVLNLNCRQLCEDPIEQCNHRGVRIGTATKPDHRRSFGTLESKQPGIVEIGRDDNRRFTASGGENFTVRHGREPDSGRMRCLMSETPEMVHGVRRHRHIDEKSHPLNSMTSSSARLAAWRSASSMSAGSR